jgi:hypothetical protein
MGRQMNYFKFETRDSQIHGRGTYAMEVIPRGQVVVNWLTDGKFIREAEHLAFLGDPVRSKSSIRLAGDIFIYGEELGETDYINHSDKPNLLYHCGLLFSRRQIEIGEELTLDYHYLNSMQEHDVVSGYEPRYALMTSAQELLQILSPEGA